MRIPFASILTVVGATLPVAASAQVNYDLVSIGYGVSTSVDQNQFDVFSAVVISFKTNKYYACTAQQLPGQSTTINCSPNPGTFRFLSGNNVKHVASLSSPQLKADGLAWQGFWQLDQTIGIVNFCEPAVAGKSACAATQVN